MLSKLSRQPESHAVNTVREPQGFQSALALFHDAAERVPAYRHFLKKHKVNHANIKAYDDFRKVPCITKDNYLKKYAFKDLLWDGKTEDIRIVSMSSGSSGEPFYWPHGNQSTQDATYLHEVLFDQNFRTKERETLVIIAFAMGTWIAGTYTLGAMVNLANKGHRLVTITPGIDKGAILRILRKFAPQFEQTIIMGYPPFVKDVLDAATDEKINVEKLNLKAVLAGEIVSEKWRDYVLKKLSAANPWFTTANIYGTADAGLLGNESPVSIYARQMADTNPELFRRLFPDTQILPSLVHYFPELRFFETEGDHLIFTANNSLPLIRYNIHDEGRVISYDDLVSALAEFGHEIPAQLKKIPQKGFLAIYGRSDVAATFYALNIYPENIKYGLEVRQLQKCVTGKFVIKTVFDDETQEQTLHLFVELKNRIQSSDKIKKQILIHVLSSLQKHNSEYNRLHQELQEKANPIIHLLPYEAPEFQIKVKQKWTQS